MSDLYKVLFEILYVPGRDLIFCLPKLPVTAPFILGIFDIATCGKLLYKLIISYGATHVNRHTHAYMIIISNISYDNNQSYLYVNN